MSRRGTPAQWAALAGVGVLLSGAVAYGQRGESPALAADPELDRLRAAAALAPCPSGGLGPDLPDLSLPCLDGGPDAPLRGAPGRPTLVNVWGSWCAPCVEEIPDLVAFAARADGEVDVVGVLTTDTARNGLAFADQFSMRYPQLVDDDGEVRARYGGGAPLTLFLDAGGRVVHVEAGQMESVEEIVALTATHLGVRL